MTLNSSKFSRPGRWHVYDYANSSLGISGFELQNLVSSTGKDWQVSIWLSPPAPIPEEAVWVHQWFHAPGDIEPSMSLGRHGDRFLLDFPEAAYFILSPCATSIEICPLSDISQETIEHLLLDQVLPRVLAKLGQMVLHGGAVQVGTGAIMLLGDTGRGKSTLTAKLASKGFPLLSDDGVVVNLSEAIATVRSTYPSLRLLPDSIAHLYRKGTRLRPVADYTDKQRVFVPLADESAATLPLQRIFVLADAKDATSDEILIRRISPRDGCVALVTNSFELDPTEDVGAMRRFGQASEIANVIPAYSLSFPRNFAHLDHVCDAILATSE